MKLQSFNPALAIRGRALIQNRPPGAREKTLADGFQASSAPPPIWKKALNSAVVSLGGAAAAGAGIAGWKLVGR